MEESVYFAIIRPRIAHEAPQGKKRVRDNEKDEKQEETETRENEGERKEGEGERGEQGEGEGGESEGWMEAFQSQSYAKDLMTFEDFHQYRKDILAPPQLP